MHIRTSIAALLLSLPGIALAQQIAIGQYHLPTTASGPDWITPGPDGALWFTDYFGNQIGRITTAGAITQYSLPAFNSKPGAIATGSDGALWFTEVNSNSIARITTAGVITEYPLGGAGPGLGAITAGPDGALWFTYSVGNIGRITTAGVITLFSIPTFESDPNGITAGPDGALWFTEGATNKIGRITTAGVVTNEYPLPTPNNLPAGITTGPDGALWFAEENTSAGKIGRITTSGVITEYAVPTANSEPAAITTGPDGKLWFTEFTGNRIGSITTAGAITEYPTPTANSQPSSITTAAGALWFTERLGNSIGEVVFPTAALTVTPASGAFQTMLTFAGSGFAAREKVQIYVGGIGSAVLVTGTTDGSGAFTVTAAATQAAYGPRLFLGVGHSSGKLGAANFSVTPKLILNPASGAVGSTVTAQGYGFGSLEGVKVYWNNPRTYLGKMTANVNGTFAGSAALTFTVPAGAPAGVNTVYGVGGITGARGNGTFTVQ